MFDSLEEICKQEENNKLPFWKIVMQDDCRERAV